jgi:hypothetical protein
MDAGTNVGMRMQCRQEHNLMISATDPEAAIQPLKSKEYRPSYRPSILAREDRVVVAKGVHATSEVEVVAGMLEQAKRVNGAPEVLLLDAGYFHEKVLELGVNDPALKHMLCPEGKTIGDGSWERKWGGEVPKSEFVYEEWRNRYRCPQGRYLYGRQESYTDRGKGYVVYRCADCQSCEKKAQCVPKNRNCRELKRYEDEELKEAMREVMRQPGARSLYRRRQGAFSVRHLVPNIPQTHSYFPQLPQRTDIHRCSPFIHHIVRRRADGIPIPQEDTGRRSPPDAH